MAWFALSLAVVTEILWALSLKWASSLGNWQAAAVPIVLSFVNMGLLALANLAALFLLFKTGLRLMDDYDTQIKAGVKSPVFDPKAFADLDLDPAAWSSKPPVVDQAAMANSVYQR